MESSKETGCQTPEGPILCVKNCGFFGSAATMNMCSKCHKETMQQDKHTDIPIFGSQGKGKEPTAFTFPGIKGFQFGSEVAPPTEQRNFSFGANSEVGTFPNASPEVKEEGSFPFAAGSEVKANAGFPFVANSEAKASAGPSRCTTCNKRVGLTGFRCRCENVFCSVHRYSDKHDCQFDYRAAGQDAIAKANPVVKAQKLDKI